MSKEAGIALNTMTKLNRDEAATLAVLEKNCAMIHTDFSDIMKYIPEDNR